MRTKRMRIVFAAAACTVLGLWYFSSRPGPKMVSGVQILIIENNRFIQNEPDGTPRRFVKIVRDPRTISEITALLDGNAYRNNNCKCLPSVYFTFINASGEQTVWAIEDFISFALVKRWFRIKRMIKRSERADFGEKYFPYEMDVPDTIPVSKARAAFSSGEWVLLPGGWTRDYREVTLSMEHRFDYPAGTVGDRYSPMPDDLEERTKADLIKLAAQFTERFPQGRPEGKYQVENRSTEGNAAVVSYSTQYRFPKSTELPPLEQFAMKFGARVKMTSTYRVVAGHPANDLLAVTADAKARVSPGVSASIVHWSHIPVGY